MKNYTIYLLALLLIIGGIYMIVSDNDKTKEGKTILTGGEQDPIYTNDSANWGISVHDSSIINEPYSNEWVNFRDWLANEVQETDPTEIKVHGGLHSQVAYPQFKEYSVKTRVIAFSEPRHLESNINKILKNIKASNLVDVKLYVVGGYVWALIIYEKPKEK